jgi:predicted molibdopterin-dependent oxidoreductase YjgC
LDRLEEYYGFKVPREGGYDVVNALKAMHEEKVKFMFCMGGISFQQHRIRPLQRKQCEN